MSSYAELYVAEDVFETFNDELIKCFGDEGWQLDLIPFDRLSKVSKEMHIDVLNDNEEKIGFLKIENEAELIEDTFGNDYFDWKPKKIIELKKF